jgi:myo-inositol-1-phosphate synthase
MEKDIKIAIAGLGNCASSLVQGIFYYKNIGDNKNPIPGLMHNVISGYKISDVKIVAVFDIDKRKVGKDVSEAIFSLPNCTKTFQKDVPNLGVEVKMGPILDGVAEHMKNYEEEKRFVVADKEPVDVTEELRKSGAEILLNYMPVGSEQAVQFYAQTALKANCAFINCMPVFIVSNPEWANKFKEKNLPIIGDDIKAQIGATILHRVLTNLLSKRGVEMDKTYQLNVGGNTDFLNMLAQERLKSKRKSKRESVQSQLSKPLPLDNIHIGPSDYVPWLKDQKICFLRIEGRNFGDIPINIEARLSVEDSPNSAGCVIDAIRLAKVALDRKIGGPLISASAYLMKSPPQQFTDEQARQMVEEFISGKREN